MFAKEILNDKNLVFKTSGDTHNTVIYLQGHPMGTIQKFRYVYNPDKGYPYVDFASFSMFEVDCEI